jgi:hypothetical protein
MLMVEISAALVDQLSSADDFPAGFGGAQPSARKNRIRYWFIYRSFRILFG